MYIKSITLEGFKSYGSKVEIKGFDPQFNAITGLNGSGKSNILDSICFVLGIQNLQQVRATNLNELVYKNGQAGINKATVTITFDNSDKPSSPIGYDNCSEIEVTRTVITGGKSKYAINRSNANNNRVHDLFQSVQLNVNNPHFLIMQGRITKVLNMKPLEILSMIEEAAGTRMYEDKKESALKNLEKKDSRLREINTMLTEHICPQMEKLKEERKEYTEYTRVVRDLEHLSRIYIAWDFTRTEEAVSRAGEEKGNLLQSFEDCKKMISEKQEQIKEAEAKISEIEQKAAGLSQMIISLEARRERLKVRESLKEGGNKLQEMEAELKTNQVSETKADTQLKNLKDALNEEIKKKAELAKSFKDEKNTLTQKQKELESSLKKLDVLKKECDKDSEAITAAENHFHAVTAGVGDDGEEASLSAQLIAAGKDKKSAETEAKSLEMSIKHIKNELAKKEAENKKVDKSYSQDQARYQKLVEEVQKLKKEISKLGYEEGKYEILIAQARKLSSELERLRDEMEAFFHRHPQCSFDYADPVKNFNRNQVRGPVCMQIGIKDCKEAIALELTAGGKLYNVIVDDEKVGKQLLNNGQLKRRCTVIPLNKIVGRPIDNRTVQEAERLVGRNNVATALSRVLYDNELRPAMEYVFGGTFICPSMEPAQKVTFDKNIRKKCVTLEGDVFEPSGTLSGGSMGNRGKMLADLVKIPDLKKAINDKENHLSQLQNQIQHIKHLKDRYDSMNQQYELKENEAQLLKSKIEQSNFHKQIEEVAKLKQTLDEQISLLASCKEKQKSAEKLIKELEVKTSKTARENKVKEAEKAVAVCKKKAAASLEKYNEFEAEMNGLKLEIDGIIEGLPSYEEQIEANAKNIEECEKRYHEAEEKKKDITSIVAELSDVLKKQKALIRAHNSEITKLNKEKEAMSKKISDAQLQMQQLEHDIKNCGDNAVEAQKKVKYLLDKHKWIDGQKKYFGVANSEFDFLNFDPKVAGPRLKELEEQKEKLHKNVNMRAQNMLSTVEDQYKNLMRKKDVVMRDKQAIENVITQLDDQKKVALRKACEQVNKDFGSIFRTLLPGTDAKLLPQPGKTVLDGLEFKVAFGDVWKESLNELSGGQRSLVALSLILALLLFNPAPIYILDEVDAALDLSHTQNIGKMLRMHFKASQFIIVSLKDGMFNNANVLFRTKFSDGMSSVARFAQRAQ